MKRWLGLFLLLFFSSQLHSQNFIHLKLELELDTINERVSGVVEHQITDLEPHDTLFLNGINMQYHELRWNGSLISFLAVDTGLFINLDELALQDTNRLLVKYQAKPRKGIYFIGWQDSTYRSRRQIWTQGQGIDHRHWIPHCDDQRDKISFELHLSFSKNYKVMSNGQLLSVTKNGDLKTWHYQQKDPMSSYLIAIAIDRYDSVRTYSNQGVPLIKYYYPERAGDLPHYYRHNEEIFNFLQNEIRVPYPWPNYKQAPVQDFRHGAMENTTATIFGDFFLVDSIAYADGNYTYVNAHELAHQWFGNYVTAIGSKHHWLHEGFATYYQWLSEGNLYGQDFFDWERYKAFNMIKAANLVDQHPLGHPHAGAARFYQKGAWVLYMLRNQIGDEVYTRAIADYLNRYAYGLVSTDSLRPVLEEHCSCALKPFFDYWVFESGEPELKAWQSDSKLYLSLIRGKWLSNLELEFWQGDSSTLRQLRAGDLKAGDTLSLDLPYPHWRILNIDRYLVETNFSKSQANWRAQYQRSEGLLESYRCLQSAADSHDQNKQAWLETIIADSTAYYPLRAKALEQLLELPVSAQQKWLWYWQTLMGEDWQLRRQILAMAPEKNPRLDSVLAEWRTQAPSYDLRFDALRMSLKPDQLESNRWLYDPIWKEYPGIPDQRIYISVLAYRYLLFQDQEALSELIDRAGISFDFLTRMKAIETLAGLKQTSEAAMQAYFTAFFNANWKLRKTAREQLDLIAQQQPEYFKAYVQKAQKNWTPLQKRRVEKRYDL